jgi:hypothetical protein
MGVIEFISKNYPDAKTSHPTDVQLKIDFPCGLVMNIYSTGSINFQGNSHKNPIVLDIKKVIDVINNGTNSNVR